MSVVTPVAAVATPLGVASEVVAQAGDKSRVLVVINGKSSENVCKPVAELGKIPSIIAEIQGAVKIVKADLRWMPCEVGAMIAIVFAKTGSNVTSTNYMSKPNVFVSIGASMNIGNMFKTPLVIPQGLAAQISPVSGQYPGAELFAYSSGKAVWAVDIELECDGMRLVACEGF